MARDAGARRASQASWLTAGAFAWSIALIAGAFVVPVYSGSGATTVSGPLRTSATLVAENGLPVLLPVAAPAALTLLIWFALHRKRSRDSRTAAVAATAGIATLAALNLLALFSIGILILPVTLALTRAAILTRPRDVPTPAQASPHLN